MPSTVPLSRELLILRLGEENPTRPWVKPLASVQTLVFSLSLPNTVAHTILAVSRWLLTGAFDDAAARLCLDNLAEVERRLRHANGSLSEGSSCDRRSGESLLRRADEQLAITVSLIDRMSPRPGTDLRQLLLPLRARAFRMRGQTAYYLRDMAAANDHYLAAENHLKALAPDGSLGPVAEVRAWALSAAAAGAHEAGEKLGPHWQSTHEAVLHQVEADDIGEPIWPTELSSWLSSQSLTWPPEVDSPETYLPMLNRSVHLRALAKYESNWAYYQASVGALEGASLSSRLAADLMVESACGVSARKVRTGRDFAWYLAAPSEFIWDAQNTGARAMLWHVAAALTEGADYGDPLESIATLAERDGPERVVQGSLGRGLANLRKVGLERESQAVESILRDRGLLRQVESGPTTPVRR